MNRLERKQRRIKHRRQAKAQAKAKLVVANKMVAAPRRLTNGLSLIASVMAQYKQRGNPKNWVVLSEHSIIYDGEKTFKISATLPENLEGEHVYVVDRFTKQQLMLRVLCLKDMGETLLLKDNRSEWNHPRSETYPTLIPGRATAVHRSRLAEYVGEKIAANWWKPNIGRVKARVADASQDG